MVRIKERYLLVNIIYPPGSPKPDHAGLPSHVVQHQPTTDELTHKSLLKAIRAEVSTLFGDYGAGALDGTLWVKYLSLATSTFIIRCPRAHYQMLWAALTFMDHVPTKDGRGRRCIFRVVRVSGTIRKAEEEAIRQARRIILAAREEEKDLGGSSFIPTLADTSSRKDGSVMDIAKVSDDESMNDSDD